MSVEVEDASTALSAMPRTIKVCFVSPEAACNVYIWYVNYQTPGGDYRWVTQHQSRHYIITAVIEPSHADFVVVLGEETEEAAAIPARRKIYFQLDPARPLPLDVGYRVLVGLDTHCKVAIPWDFTPYMTQMNRDYPLKEKDLVVICSGKTATPLQRRRLELLKLLAADSGISMDIYSRDLQASDFPPGAPFRGCHQPRDKSAVLLPYRYCLSIEKVSQENYISNHFVDPLLSYCMPLYHGAPNADTLYPPECFHKLQQFPEDLEATLNEIRARVQQPVSVEEIAAMSEARRRILNHFTLWATLRQHLPEMMEQAAPL
jgi:hypothetical protein